MKRTGWASLGVAAMLAILAGACAPAPPPPPAGPTADELKAAADALDRQFKEAFNKGDVDGLMATYWNSPSLVSIGPDTAVQQGWDATRTSATQMFAGIPGAQLELIEGHNDVHGDVVIGWGRWRMTIPGPTPTVVEGRYTDAKAMRDGKMVYIMDHASVPMPPPPAGK